MAPRASPRWPWANPPSVQHCRSPTWTGVPALRRGWSSSWNTPRTERRPSHQAHTTRSPSALARQNFTDGVIATVW